MNWEYLLIVVFLVAAVSALVFFSRKDYSGRGCSCGQCSQGDEQSGQKDDEAGGRHGS
ncbi:hypothetical protein [Desulfonatronospira sp.]|uniref:hypothetical protein n=1 Tax=Desulfonatronospira sp. TaxID=1962951 RepID=UPI0025BD1965|nr:hypothetical protein [Desulfonatronospira sp.]